MAATSIYDRIYDSALHHPGLCFVAAVPILWALVRHRPRPASPGNGDATWLWRFALSFQLLIVADALWTGAWAPLPAAHPVTVAMAIFWVLVGDFRYFLLVEHFTDERRRTLRSLARAAGWTMVMPLLTAAIKRFVPTLAATPRATFLLYESLCVAVLLVQRFVVLPRRLARIARPGVASWLSFLWAIELGQYLLWAGCDVIILFGLRAGLLPRIVPNVVYYVALVPAAYFLAPWTGREIQNKQ